MTRWMSNCERIDVTERVCFFNGCKVMMLNMYQCLVYDFECSLYFSAEEYVYFVLLHLYAKVVSCCTHGIECQVQFTEVNGSILRNVMC